MVFEVLPSYRKQNMYFHEIKLHSLKILTIFLIISFAIKKVFYSNLISIACEGRTVVNKSSISLTVVVQHKYNNDIVSFGVITSKLKATKNPINN